MNTTLLQSPLLAPARFVWRALRRITWIRRAVENGILYPRLPYIRRSDNYPAGPLLIAGFFSSAHGIGEAARLELAAQRAVDERVLGVDISPPFNLYDMPVPEGVVPLEQAPVHGPLLLHCNAPEAGRALQFLGKRLTSNRRIIGYWAWELEVAPRDWERAYPYLDELWVPSTFTAKAFSAASIPVTVHPHPVVPVPDGGHSLTELGLPQCEGKTVFLCMADARSDLVRKNIRGIVQAFSQACGGNAAVALIVKLHHAEYSSCELQNIRKFCASFGNINLVETMFSSAQRNSLLHRVQAVISLHRAEGFGLMLAEAKVLSKKIIATAYSGPMDYLDMSTAELVPFSLVTVCSETANYKCVACAQWADPEVEVAVSALKIILNKCSSQ